MTNYTYDNTTCDRCNNPKEKGTETLWCDECDALPMCDECGRALVDCNCDEGDDTMSDWSERMAERSQMGLCNF